jgi:hypothetical protein
VRFIGRGCLAVALAVALGAGDGAHAFEVPTGSDDLVIHWDNTFRYTLAGRVRGQSEEIVGSVNNDDGDRNFDVGLVSSRIDLLTEADAVFKKDFGIRLSAAGWYDPIYRGSLDNKSVGTSNHFVNGQQALGLNSYTKDRFGLDAELLDAFAFAKIDAGDVPINVRAGRHTIYWGEAFFPYAGNNGISYGQSPIDIAKALAMPGVELKEIFRPLNQVSVQVQPTKELTFAAQYYLQWESNLFPEGGSYLGMVDPWLNGGESALLPFGPIFNAGDRKPSQTGDWGVMARWSPEALNSTFGFYYRNFSDKIPQVLSDFAAGGGPPLNYHLSYGSDIDLYGISFARQILGVSVGSELSYRRNMPLSSQWLAPAGARGDTMHAVLNFLALLPKTWFFDTGSTILEFTYGRYNKVTRNAQFFNGRDGYAGLDRVTRDNTTVAINFAPEWKQVFQSVDLTMPMSFATGLSGTSAVTGGGAKDNGSYSVGLSFDILAKYKVDLTYASFFGTVHPDGGGQVLPPGNAAPGQGAGDIFGLLKDRDLLSLTLKTTF